MSTSRVPYPDSFRTAAVARVDDGQPIAQVAREIGVARNTLKAWMIDRLAPADDGATQGTVSAAASTGSRRAALIALRDATAARIDAGIPANALPGNARLLDELMRTITALDAQEEAESEHVPKEVPFDWKLI